MVEEVGQIVKANKDDQIPSSKFAALAEIHLKKWLSTTTSGLDFINNWRLSIARQRAFSNEMLTTKTIKTSTIPITVKSLNTDEVKDCKVVYVAKHKGTILMEDGKITEYVMASAIHVYIEKDLTQQVQMQQQEKLIIHPCYIMTAFIKTTSLLADELDPLVSSWQGWLKDSSLHTTSCTRV